MPYLICLFFMVLIYEGCGGTLDLATQTAKNAIAFDECFAESPSPRKVEDLTRSYKNKCTYEELKNMNARFECLKNACLQFFKPEDQEAYKKFAPAMKACPELENIRDTCKNN